MDLMWEKEFVPQDAKGYIASVNEQFSEIQVSLAEYKKDFVNAKLDKTLPSYSSVTEEFEELKEKFKKIKESLS